MGEVDLYRVRLAACRQVMRRVGPGMDDLRIDRTHSPSQDRGAADADTLDCHVATVRLDRDDVVLLARIRFLCCGAEYTSG